MIEKIRLTLWDIFSFFLTGFIVLVVVLLIMANYNHLSLSECLIFVKTLPDLSTLYRT